MARQQKNEPAKLESEMILQEGSEGFALYYTPNPCSKAVYISLHEVSDNIDITITNLLNNEPSNPDCAALTPPQMVHVLVVNGKSFDSNEVCRK